MFENNYVLFDVGTNWGEDSLPKCANDPNVLVWAFEPTPQLADHLRRASTNFSDRYTVVPVALENFDGEAEFHIQNNPGMGQNSLNTYNQDAVNNHWDRRTPEQLFEFSSSSSIKVPVFKLETWINANLPGLDHIDHFHCDTQGSDLRVLMGMGDYINLIRSGKVECARDKESRLYNESTNFVDDVCDFLESKGFKINDIQSNDYLGNELNVYFEKIK